MFFAPSSLKSRAAWCALALGVGILSRLSLPLGAAESSPPASSAVVDRQAVERVYYLHRLGEKAPFEVAVPLSAIERLVSQDRAKESALREVYGVVVKPEWIAAEVERINTTTRAPEVLAELKAALGNDPVRFSQAVARPLVVDRRLRQEFSDDTRVHGPQRLAAEQARSKALAGRQQSQTATTIEADWKGLYPEQFSEVTWDLGPVPSETSSTEPSASSKLYFAELPPELQQVLRVQLREPGQVSAVIELPQSFRVYLAIDVTATSLRVACLNWNKLSLEEWLERRRLPSP